MTQIAIYGKGGIGKSTISANLSASLAKKGKRVLQIGCDPKHDSTRLLLGGEVIPTVVNYLRDSPPDKRCLEDILFEGYKGVACVEAGGPEPGVGCAGRGILSTFELLRELDIDQIPFDVVVYDVLGDVVCGGFAVPLRKEYADSVFLVTSGEYMALYAANNILRGIRSFGTSAPGVAGIIHNSRGLDHEDRRVKAFSKAVDLPIIASIPRSEYFSLAEKQGGTLSELYPASKPALIFKVLADYVEKLSRDETISYMASPLTDIEMERLVLGRKEISRPSPFQQYKKRPGLKTPGIKKEHKKTYYTRAIKNKQPLQGCSFAGAVTVTSQLTDCMTIAHGPRSCSHIVSDFLNKTLMNASFRYGATGTHEPSLLPTDMDDSAFIFGGSDKLRDALKSAINNGWKNLIVVTTCPAGLIGDNIENVINETKKEHPATSIFYLPMDGNLAGDFSQGLIESYKKILDIVDDSVKEEENLVNIVGEKILSNNLETNHLIIEDLLTKIGISVNCRYLANTKSEDVKNFRKAKINLLAHEDGSGTLIRDMLESKLSMKFFEHPYPSGFNETARWLKDLAVLFNKEKEALKIIEIEEQRYKAEIAKLRPHLQGKTVLISTFSVNLDWIIDTIIDAGMQVEKIGLAVSPKIAEFSSHYKETIPVQYDYTSEQRIEDIKKLGPDLVLSNYPPIIPSHPVHHDAIPFSPEVGFYTGLIMAQKWSRLLRLPVIEGWKLEMEAEL